MKFYSTNNEEFRYESVDDALESLIDEIDLKAGSVIEIWEGEAEKPMASRYTPDITDCLQDAASDDCGDAADLWEFSKEDTQSLREAVMKTVDEWATSNGMQPDFYRIISCKSFKVRLTSDAGTWEEA